STSRAWPPGPRRPSRAGGNTRMAKWCGSGEHHLAQLERRTRGERARATGVVRAQLEDERVRIRGHDRAVRVARVPRERRRPPAVRGDGDWRRDELADEHLRGR